MSLKLKLQNLLIIFVAGFFAIAFAVPILLTVSNSFMTGFEINNRYSIEVLPVNYFRLLDAMPNISFVDMALIPAWASLSQYAILLFDTPSYFDNLWSSIIITGPAVFGQVLIALPAAYAFEYCKWKHKEKLFFVYIVVMLMPLPVVLVPQFVVAGFLGIQNSVLAVILPAIVSPFGVFLLRQFLKNIPIEYVEAAKMDGAGHILTLVIVVAPMLKPAIAALAILVFIDYWNVVEQAIVFITDTRRLPLSVALSSINPEIIFAASCFYMLPALLIFLYGQEHLIEGIQLSGIK